MRVESNLRAAAGAASGGGRRRQTPGGAPLRAACALLIAAVSAAALLSTPPPRARAQTPLKCNGAEYLCDRRFDQITFPTTHNSHSKVRRPPKVWVTPNQFREVSEQLLFGIRGFMIDVYWRDGETRLCHEGVNIDGTCPGGYVTFWKEREPGSDDIIVLEDIRKFLAENPNEVITIMIESYATPEQVAGAFEGAGLVPNLYVFDPEKGWPTLREMIRKNQRVLVLTQDRMEGQRGPNGGHVKYPWMHYEFHLASESPYAYPTIDKVGRGNPGYCQDDPKRPYTVADPGLFILNHFLSDPHLAHRANAMNNRGFILDSAIYCHELRGEWPNFIAVDYENCDSQNGSDCTLATGGHSNVGDIVLASTTLNEYRLIRPADIVVDAEPGECGARVDFPALSVAARVTTSQPSGSFFPVGTTAVTAASEFGDTISFNVTVLDRESPALSLSVGRPALWPPNNELTDVALSAVASDNCGAAPPVEVTVFSDEDDARDSSFSPDARRTAAGGLRLRAERAGGDGRVYLIVARTRDEAGNRAASAATVVVPHDGGAAASLSVGARAASALEYFKAHGAPPPGYLLVGDGPVAGPRQ